MAPMVELSLDFFLMGTPSNFDNTVSASFVVVTALLNEGFSQKPVLLTKIADRKALQYSASLTGDVQVWIHVSYLSRLNQTDERDGCNRQYFIFERILSQLFLVHLSL